MTILDMGYLFGSVDMNEFWYCVGAGKQHNRGHAGGKIPHVKVKKEKDKHKKKDKKK